MPKAASPENSGAHPDVTDRVDATASGGVQLPPAGTGNLSIRVADGPVKGLAWSTDTDRGSIGSHTSNDLVLADPTVSRFHCELSADPRGLRVVDLDSRNGTLLDGVRVSEAFGRSGSVLRLGESVLVVQMGDARSPVVLSERTRFGSMVGRSTAIRATFSLLERASASDITVLLEGETGTGKGAAAEGVHAASARSDKPFVVVDCGAISASLLESELFGHEKGAFTGAASRRAGAFESAEGGTVFLDEIGELPLDLQPKLLRVLEEREVRRLGSTRYLPIDVRVIAATHRDLRELVNTGAFRSDLYFRLSVLRIQIPPLRSRMDDVPEVVRGLLAAGGVEPARIEALATDEFMQRLQAGSWPGNVRELRNYLERCLVLDEPQPILDEAAPVDTQVRFSTARNKALREFERRYLDELLRRHGGRVVEVARAAGLDRGYVYRLLQRNGLKDESPAS